VFRVVDFDSLVAPVFVPEKYLADLRVGQRAVLQPPSLAGTSVEGRVVRVSPVVDSQSGTIRVTIDPAARAELRPGMFANVQLELDRHDGVVIVEKRALVYDDEVPHVYVVEDGAAIRREVETGYESGDRVEVQSGVAAGDLVVVVGQSGLKDGSRVQAEDEDGNPIGPPPSDASTESAEPEAPGGDDRPAAKGPREKRPGRRP
jgi:membrane fusion protein (multidrug efflux system)